MSRDLERNVDKQRREKSAHAKKIAEMRAKGASSAKEDMVRAVSERQGQKKAANNAKLAFKSG